MKSLTKSEVNVYRDKPDFIAMTARQVIKDFATFGMAVAFSGDREMAYEELFGQLEKHVRWMLEHDLQKLQALLYQIDVDESKIHSEQLNNPGWDYSQVVTELILFRELKKVVLRQYIKENPGWFNQL